MFSDGIINIIAVLLTVAACRGAPPAGVAHALPRIGIAVSDSTRAWCAEFIGDSTASPLEPGAPATIVFGGSRGLVALRARVRRPREDQCPAAFAQPRWIDYQATLVDLTDSIPRDAEVSTVALIVVGDVSWIRGADSVSRADLDGDGVPEEVRRCSADEGEHFTVWSTAREGTRTRRWHEYYDWGGFTDPTCRPGEDGLETSAARPT